MQDFTNLDLMREGIKRGRNEEGTKRDECEQGGRSTEVAYLVFGLETWVGRITARRC